MQEAWVQSLGGEDPLEKERATLFLPGTSCGQRSLEGYSPWGYKQSDMIWWLSMYALFNKSILCNWILQWNTTKNG